MPKTIEITMRPGGFDVITGGKRSSFRNLADAVAFAQARFERAQEIREISSRIG
jgi:hypothetical protein